MCAKYWPKVQSIPVVIHKVHSWVTFQIACVTSIGRFCYQFFFFFKLNYLSVHLGYVYLLVSIKFVLPIKNYFYFSVFWWSARKWVGYWFPFQKTFKLSVFAFSLCFNMTVSMIHSYPMCWNYAISHISVDINLIIIFEHQVCYNGISNKLLWARSTRHTKLRFCGSFRVKCDVSLKIPFFLLMAFYCSSLGYC